MHERTVHAVVVRLSDYGEAHRIVDLLTREEGLVRAFAPSCRGSRRRFAGALEPGNRISAVVRTSAGRSLANLEEASLEGGLGNVLRSDLFAMLRAGWMVDLCRSLVRDEQPHEDLYDLLSAGIELLDEARLPPWGLVAFEVAALGSFGVTPRFDACSRCDRPPKSERSRFSPGFGGLLCPACSPGWGPGDVALARSTLGALRALAESGSGKEALARSSSLPDAPAHVAEARGALSSCTQHVLGRSLKSRELLDRMDPSLSAVSVEG